MGWLQQRHVVRWRASGIPCKPLRVRFCGRYVGSRCSHAANAKSSYCNRVGPLFAPFRHRSNVTYVQHRSSVGNVSVSCASGDGERAHPSSQHVQYSVGDVSLELIEKASEDKAEKYENTVKVQPEEWGEEQNIGEWGAAAPSADYTEPDAWGLAALTTVIVVAGLCAFSFTRKGHSDASTPYVKQQPNIQVVVEPAPSSPSPQHSTVIADDLADSQHTSHSAEQHDADQWRTAADPSVTEPSTPPQVAGRAAAADAGHDFQRTALTSPDVIGESQFQIPSSSLADQNPDSPHPRSDPIPVDPLTAIRTDPNLHASLEQLLHSPGERTGKQLSPAEQHLMAVLSQQYTNPDDFLREAELFGLGKQQQVPWPTQESWAGIDDTRSTHDADNHQSAVQSAGRAQDTAGEGTDRGGAYDAGVPAAAESTHTVVIPDSSLPRSGQQQGAATDVTDSSHVSSSDTSLSTPGDSAFDTRSTGMAESAGAASVPETDSRPSSSGGADSSASTSAAAAVTIAPSLGGLSGAGGTAPLSQPLWTPPWQQPPGRQPDSSTTFRDGGGLVPGTHEASQLDKPGGALAGSLPAESGPVGERGVAVESLEAGQGAARNTGLAAAMKLQLLDAGLARSSGLLDLEMEAEPPARAVQPHEVEALDSERTMPSLRERAQIALRAAAAASQASQRAAAYSAAASSAASKAAEAAEKAAGAATAAQAALEDAAEDSIQAAEARVALAVEAAAEAEERAASAAAVATAYQDISETQAVVARKAAFPPQQHTAPEGMVGAVHALMTQLGEGIAAVLQPFINFFSPYVGAVTGWLLFIWNELHSITSRAVQFITKPFS